MGYIWDLWDQNVAINQLVEVTEMMCFAAKWVGEKGMQFYSNPADGHRKMVAHAHRLLSEADAVLTYNGRKFDVRHLNREFLEHGFGPPAPFQQIDLYRVVKKHFAFPSYKLEYVSKALGLKGKVSTGGFELWRDCKAGVEKAWRRMENYNKRDVRLTEELYDYLLPWITDHPARPLYDGKGGCPNCGSEKLQRRGYTYTRVSRYRRLRCMDCGTWTRESKRDANVTLQGVAS